MGNPRGGSSPPFRTKCVIYGRLPPGSRFCFMTSQCQIGRAQVPVQRVSRCGWVFLQLFLTSVLICYEMSKMRDFLVRCTKAF